MDEAQTQKEEGLVADFEITAEKRELIDFLFTYQTPDAQQIEAMKFVRGAARALALVLECQVPPSPDRTDAMRKLQECVNTANRGITLRGRSYR